MSSKSSRKRSPETSKAKTRYDDNFLDLLESTISDYGGPQERGRRNDSHERRSNSNRGTRSGRRKRSTERRRSRSRSHPRTHSPQKKKKPTFLEEIQEKYPDIRSEIEERTIENNMKALQMFGMQPEVMNQQCVVEPNQHFFPVFPQEQFSYGKMVMRPEFYTVPTSLVEIPILPVEPVPAPMKIESPRNTRNLVRPTIEKFPSFSNPEPPGSVDYPSPIPPGPVDHPSPVVSPEKRETPEIDIQSATKKAFEEGNIGLSDFLRSKVLENKKKMEATNIQVKKRQALERCKRSLQMLEDIQKGKIILPLFFKPPSKHLPSLKQDPNIANRSPLALSDTNLKFSWQVNSMDAFLSNPCSNISAELAILARNVPLDLSELSQRAKTRAKIEKNKQAQAAKNIIETPIVVPKPSIKRINEGSQTEPLICISCDIRAKTLITTQGTMTDENFQTVDATEGQAAFKFQLNSHELSILNNEQRYALSDFCKAFNLNCESFVDILEPVMPLRRSPSYHDARNSSPPRNSRSPLRRSIHEQQHNEMMAQNDQFINFGENHNYMYRDRSGSPNSPIRRHAFLRLGQKVLESPRNIIERPQRFYEDNVVMIQNDRFIHQSGDHERASPLERRLTRSRSPIFRRLEPMLSPTIPPMNRFESPPRNTSRERYISPPRDEYPIEDGHRNYRSPIRRLNGSPIRMRNLSPPPRSRSPVRNDYNHMKRHASPHRMKSTHVEYRNTRSRSPSPRVSNWFHNSRTDFDSGPSRLSSRRGRY